MYCNDDQCTGIRQTGSYKCDWFFKLGDIQYGGKEYKDCSSWGVVDLPHDWSVQQNASPELASCTGYLPGGIGWYRKELVIPAEERGNRQQLLKFL